MAHKSLFLERPVFIRAPAQLTIDEAFWPQSLNGVDGDRFVELSELLLHREIIYEIDGATMPDSEVTKILMETSARAHDALSAISHGRTLQTALRNAGVNAVAVLSPTF